jgi:hypothetical protein
LGSGLVDAVNRPVCEDLRLPVRRDLAAGVDEQRESVSPAGRVAHQLNLEAQVQGQGQRSGAGAGAGAGAGVRVEGHEWWG